jgi:hypothetical protein
MLFKFLLRVSVNVAGLIKLPLITMILEYVWLVHFSVIEIGFVPVVVVQCAGVVD